MSDKTPISMQLALALMSNDQELVDKIISQAFGEMTNKVLSVAHEYPMEDRPFVIATMLITANAMRNLLDEQGNRLVEKIMSQTTSVIIDKDEVMRQAKGETDE